MKKSLIYTSLAALALLVGGGITYMVGSASANENSPAVAVAEGLSAPSIIDNLATKNESVYIITDYAGVPTKTFVGNTLANTTNPLPVEVKITYTLDGAEISAAELAGKSGHVRIVYDYASVAQYQSKLVPFLALTGVQLDGSKFSNIKVTNGKIISEGDNTMIAGYAMAGLDVDLGTDLVPSSFTIEADVKDFALESTYTLATNEIFADIDTSKLSTVDELIGAMGELDYGISRILDGATQLDSGLDSLVAGVATLQSGAESLNSGASQLADGASALSAGATELAGGLSELDSKTAVLASGVGSLASNLNSLASNGATLNAYLDSAIDATIAQVNAAISAYGQSIDRTNYSTVLPAIIAVVPDSSKPALVNAKNSLDLHLNLQAYIAGASAIAAGADQLNANMPTLADGVSKLNSGASALATGAADLSTGANQLAAGTVELKTGVDTLASGASQLSSGSKTLKDGIATFKAEGIDKLVDFAQNDLASFAANLRASVNAAKSYHSYQTTTATSVKFIFKTPSIK